MQTFLPYADFAMSARVLDRQRLGKQRVETLQIMNALLVPGYGWANHPAVRMWRGYERALGRYQEAVCAEWVARGYQDSCLAKTRQALAAFETAHGARSDADPEWLGRDDVHRSHRSNLKRKWPEFYGPLFEEGLEMDLAYVWPE